VYEAVKFTRIWRVGKTFSHSGHVESWEYAGTGNRREAIDAHTGQKAVLRCSDDNWEAAAKGTTESRHSARGLTLKYQMH
jgi:hypothetical protein